MNYRHYINQPQQAVELKIYKNNAQNPHLIKSLDRTFNNLLIGKISHIPFNK